MSGLWSVQQVPGFSSQSCRKNAARSCVLSLSWVWTLGNVQQLPLLQSSSYPGHIGHFCIAWHWTIIIAQCPPQNIYCFKPRKGIFIPDAVALPCLCLRLNMRAARFLVIYFQLLTSCFFFLCLASQQELVRLRGDAHRQLRDGGRGGDVHQARLPALHLGPVSSSGVSIALPIRFFFLFICGRVTEG